MTYPITLRVLLDLSNGPSFAPGFTIGLSQLGIDALAAAGAEVVDLSSQTIAIRTKRGRDLKQDQFNPGIATIRVLDPNGDFNPQNISSPLFGKLQPLRKIRIAAIYEGFTYYLYTGYTTDYKYTYPKSEEFGYIDISCSDAISLFSKAAITTVTGAGAGDTTGDRINQILDTIGFPATQRNIDTGDVTVQNDPGNLRSVLQALQDVEFTEFGALFIDPLGNVIFLSQSDIANYNFLILTTEFNQDPNLGITYSNLKFAFNDQLVFNVANFQRVGGTMQTYINQDSIDNLFPHTITRQNLLHEDDTAVYNLATQYVENRKNTTIRIDSITLDLTTPNYQDGIEAALQLDFLSPVKINNIQPGGSVIEKELQVFGVQHEITPSKWFTTLTTSEPLLRSGFIIGDPDYAIIGVSRF